MAKKVKENDPTFYIPPGSWGLPAKSVVKSPKTESIQLISYPGWDELIKDLEPKSPEQMLSEASESLKKEWEKYIAPHSPLTPEDAAFRALGWEIAADSLWGILLAGLIAAEAAGFGQMETPAMLIPMTPSIRALINAATRARETYFDASFGIGLRYKALADHQPTIIPPDILVDAYLKGVFDLASFQSAESGNLPGDYKGKKTAETLYKGLMMYHGYTPVRSDIIAMARTEMPDIGTLLRLLRRGIISKEGFIDWGRFHRIPKKTLEAVAQLFEEVPEPYRLAEIITKGLCSNDDFIKAMAWHGIQAEWAWRWAEAQIRFPDPFTALELLRRGAIDAKTYKEWMRRNQIYPETADKLLTLRKQLFDVRTLAELTARGVLADRFAVAYAKQLGFEEGEFTGYIEASRRFPDYATIIDLYLRGFIDEETAKRWLRRLGFSLEVVEAVFKLKDALPSTGDLITMVVREAFVPEMVVEAPEVFAKYMKMRGFSKEWSDRYWTAHFRPIPIEYAYDNVRRGLHDFDWLRRVLFIHDIHPNYIDDIVNVIYNPPSLRELGYGYDVGIYTLDDIKKYRMWGGLSPEDAEKAAQAMVAYRTEAERNAVRTELMLAYGQGRITREEFEQRLKELKTPEAAIEYWLLRGDLYKERISWEPPQTEGRSITRADAIWAFVRGLRDERWLRDVLKKIGYSDDAVELYVAVAKQKLADEQKPPEEPQPRRLTLSQIKTAYIAGLITKDEAVRRIKAMGFTEQDANLVLEVMLYEPVSEPKIKPFTRGDVTSFYRYGLWDEEDVFNAFKEMGYDDAHAGLLTMLEVLDDMYPKLKMLYEKGYIDDQELLRKFIDLGLSPSDAQNVVKRLMFELSMERIKEERSLTKSEIIKGVKKGVFGFEDGVQMLKDLGYSDAEARYILVINAIVAAGDPMGYWEMRRAVELMKKAQGKPYIEIPDEVIMQERLIEEQKRKIEEMKARGESEEVIAAEMGALAQMEAAFRKLLKKYNLVP